MWEITEATERKNWGQEIEKMGPNTVALWKENQERKSRLVKGAAA